MTVNRHLDELYGLRSHTFPALDGGTGNLPAPDAVAWRFNTNHFYSNGEDWNSLFARFCDTVDTTRVKALIVGQWGDASSDDSAEAVKTLVAARDSFPALRAVFIGDMVGEECEISWIRQTDVTPLLTGFPELEEFGVRGGSGLEFPATSHRALRKLVIQTGGLSAEVVRGVGAGDLPALEHLDLWLGTDEYGGDSEVADLEPFLSGARLPRLRHLALRNSEIQDEIAVAVAAAPVVARLEVLDLSMGILTDEGAAALLAGQPLTHLKKLDLHHNYLTEPLMDRLLQTLGAAGVEVGHDHQGAEEEEGEVEGETGREIDLGE
ncbi:STM4015 family protein, partial [Streptomyces sp. NPDC002920]